MTAEAGSTLIGSINGIGDVFNTPATGGPQALAFDVPLGSHTVTIVAIDVAGNRSGALNVQASYTAPAAPRVSQFRDPAREPLLLNISGPPTGAFKVTLSNGHVGTGSLTNGAATAIMTVPDGEYTANVVVADRRGTESPPTAAEVVVDTEGPDIVIKVDKKAARSDGALAFTVKTERGAAVEVETSKLKKLTKDYTAQSKGRTFRAEGVKNGRYEVDVIATDEYGNETARSATVKIA